MLVNNCDGEGKLGEEDMAVGFVCAGRLAVRARVGVEEGTNVGVAAILTVRTTRRSKELHVRIEILFSTMFPHGRRSTSNESFKMYLSESLAIHVIHELFASLVLPHKQWHVTGRPNLGVQYSQRKINFGID